MVLFYNLYCGDCGVLLISCEKRIVRAMVCYGSGPAEMFGAAITWHFNETNHRKIIVKEQGHKEDKPK